MSTQHYNYFTHTVEVGYWRSRHYQPLRNWILQGLTNSNSLEIQYLLTYLSMTLSLHWPPIWNPNQSYVWTGNQTRVYCADHSASNTYSGVNECDTNTIQTSIPRYVFKIAAIDLLNTGDGSPTYVFFQKKYSKHIKLSLWKWMTNSYLAQCINKRKTLKLMIY